MENTSTALTPIIDTTNSEISTQAHNNSEHIKAQVTLALSALDSLYKKNISDYAQKVHESTLKIDNARNRLEQLNKAKKPHEETLSSCQIELDYTLRLLERLSEEWCQKSLVIVELENEFSTLDYSEEERKKRVEPRQNTVKKVAFEIENIELSLLEHELEKQNILILIEPIEREITLLERTLRELESEKRYIEASYLHHLSPAVQNANVTLTH